jgi:hypothetical protein
MLSAGYSHANYSGSGSYNSFSGGLGYFIRKYSDLSEQFGWFLEYNAQGTVIWSENNSPTRYYRSSYVSAGLHVLPGLYYKASPKVVIEAGFGGVGLDYSTTLGGSGSYNSLSLGLNFPSNFTFGLQFLLPKKKTKDN